SFTDWHDVRKQFGVDSIDTTGAAQSKWLNRAYDKDFTATSAISDESVAMTKYFGFSAADADWEAYAQSTDGAVLVLRMDDGADFDTFAKNLKARGYKEPKSDDGVWNGGPDLLSTIDPELSPELQYVTLLRKKHLVVTSDKLAYAGEAAKVADGHGDTLAGKVGNTTDLAGKTDHPIAAVLWSRDFACSDLAMTHASAADQKRADQLIAAAGKTSALSGLMMSMNAAGVVTVAEQFESGSQARENLRARAKLAVGPAVGRGEDTFGSDYTLTSSRTKGSTVLLTMKPHDRSQFPLSSIYDGAVIFATC
ncbi:MAG TPA: hypothetical protein VF426_01225, partial [Marmoricola sp.]